MTQGHSTLSARRLCAKIPPKSNAIGEKLDKGRSDRVAYYKLQTSSPERCYAAALRRPEAAGNAAALCRDVAVRGFAPMKKRGPLTIW
jgi:hypothetical protein